MPAYMKEVLHFDIDENGLFSALPHVGLLVGTLIVGEVADLLRRKNFSTAAVRKWAMGIGLIVPAAFMIGVSLVSCEDRIIGVVLMILALTFNAFTRVGYMVNHLDIAPRYSGELYGFSNTFATIPGMVSPTLVNSLTVNGTQEEWQIVFYIWAAIFVFGAIVFVIFAKGKIQSWASDMASTDNSELDHKKVEIHAPFTSSSQADLLGAEAASASDINGEASRM